VSSGHRCRRTLAAALALLCLSATRADAYVYWGNRDDHTIGRAALDGSGVDQHFLTLPDEPAGSGSMWGLALDDAHVLWSHFSVTGGAIGRVGLDGSGVTPDFVTTAGFPTGVVTDDAHLYWANGTSGADPASGSIGRAELDGANANAGFVQKAAWTVNGVAVDAGHVYWANGSGHQTIGRANLDGTASDQSFISGLDPTSGVAVAGQYVYWSTGTAIGRAKLDGSEVDKAFVSATAYGIAVDAGHIYWAGGSVIGRAKLDGSDVEPQWIGGANRAYVVAVDDRAATTTTLTPSRAHAIYGEDLVFTAVVAAGGNGAATGHVTFKVTGAPPASVPVGGAGSATFDPPYLLDVGDTVTASYSGDAHHGPSRDVLAVDLRPAATSLAATLRPDQVTPGTEVTLDVAVRNAETWIPPFGAVFIAVNDRNVAAEPLDDDGLVTVSLTPSKPGDLRVTAHYHDSTGLPPDFVDSEQTVVLHVAAPLSAAPGTSTAAPAAPAVTAAPKPRRCKVPALKGLTLTAGKRRLAKAGCRLGKVTRKKTARARRGRVVATSPVAGKTTTQRVRLVVGR